MDEIAKPLTERPVKYLGDLYSNYDHDIDNAVAYELQAGDCFAFHYAWNFCGSVWYVPSQGKWVNQIHVYTVVTEHIIGDSVDEVIQKANDKYGDD
jgi:hypothetical protein